MSDKDEKKQDQTKSKIPHEKIVPETDSSPNVWADIFEQADEEIQKELEKKLGKTLPKNDTWQNVFDEKTIEKSSESEIDKALSNVFAENKDIGEPISPFPTVHEILNIKKQFGKNDPAFTKLFIKEVQTYVKKRREKVFARLKREYLKNVATIDKYYYGMIYDCLLLSTSINKNIDSEAEQYSYETDFTEITKFHDKDFHQED